MSLMTAYVTYATRCERPPPQATYDLHFARAFAGVFPTQKTDCRAFVQGVVVARQSAPVDSARPVARTVLTSCGVLYEQNMNGRSPGLMDMILT